MDAPLPPPVAVNELKTEPYEPKKNVGFYVSTTIKKKE